MRGKLAQGEAIDKVEEEAVASLPEEEKAERESWVRAILHEMVKEQFRQAVLDKSERLDGRAFDEIRKVTCEVGLLPRTHGSALFTRGETQALVTCTLGTSEDIQIIEALEGESQQRFLLHYNFPPFSVGEVKFMRGPGRREIGHGNLARRALTPVMPAKETFPYTLRVVSDILESNGSSSMATVCGGTLVADGRRGADRGPGGRRGDGPGLRRHAPCGPHRHRRPGRPLRRHGLQGRRHPRRRHRPADGHQGLRASRAR